jgi:hypothetical protein
LNCHWFQNLRPPASRLRSAKVAERHAEAAAGDRVTAVQAAPAAYRGPLLDLAPRQVFTRGTGALPGWFVQWAELEGAMSDGALFIAELRGLPSLQGGYAIQFDEHRLLSEILDPSAPVTTLAWDGVSKGAPSSADTLRKFEFSYNLSRGRIRDVRIRFN